MAGEDERCPATAYRELPEPVREWLETLRKEDIAEIEASRKFMRDAMTIGKFGRWLFFAAVGVFAAVVTFLQGIPVIKNFLTGGK